MAKLGKVLGPLSVAAAMGQAAMAAREHWGLLSGEERRRLAELVRRSGGRTSNLSGRERRELSELVKQLELARLGRRLAQSASPLPGRLRARR
jgi:hypothetical protein